MRHEPTTFLPRQRGRDTPRRIDSDDCDSEADDYYSYDTSKQLKTFRVNTMPPINEWVVVESGVSFQRCVLRSLAVCGEIQKDSMLPL